MNTSIKWKRKKQKKDKDIFDLVPIGACHGKGRKAEWGNGRKAGWYLIIFFCVQIFLKTTQERLDEMEQISYSLTKVLGLNSVLSMQHHYNSYAAYLDPTMLEGLT